VSAGTGAMVLTVSRLSFSVVGVGRSVEGWTFVGVPATPPPLVLLVKKSWFHWLSSCETLANSRDQPHNDALVMKYMRMLKSSEQAQ
jgi:hypothetical protein